jgi:DNA-binding FadR family transcriptional regulator
MEDTLHDHGRFVQYDLLFHQAIFRVAGNRVCSMMFTVVHQSLESLMHLTSKFVEPEHTLQLHKRIYNAIRHKDPQEARRRMTEHLENAMSLLRGAADLRAQTSLGSRIGELAAIARSGNTLLPENGKRRRKI